MHKIDGAGHVNGSWVNEDVALQRPPTEITADIMNALQSEIVNVIEGAGFTLNKPTNTQLLSAIQALIKGGDYKDSVRVASAAPIDLAAPGAIIGGVTMELGNRFLEKDNATLSARGIYIWNGAAVPATRALDADTGAEFNSGAIIPVESGIVNADTNWQITNDGVVIIGTTGLTFQQMSSHFATSAEAQGLSLLTKNLSPGGLAAALQGANQSLAANGYQKIPGGLILQWGEASFATPTTTGGTTTITLPIAFPTAFLNVTGTYKRNVLINGANSVYTSIINNNSFTLVLDVTTEALATSNVYWFAIGY